MWSADYSQIRAAHHGALFSDSVLVKLSATAKTIHARTAQEVFGVGRWHKPRSTAAPPRP